MTLAEQTSRMAQIGDLSIHYHDLGSGGRPVILLHGGGPGADGWSNFSRNAEAFAARGRTLIIDLPGFGRSTKKAATESVFQFMSDAVLGVMDHLGIDVADLVGNSLGGGTALRLCLRAPDRVGRLVLMGTAGSTPLFSPLSDGARRLFGYYRDGGPTVEKLRGIIDCLVHDSKAISDDLINQRFQASLNPEVVASPPLKMLGRHADDELWRANLSALKNKVLLVWGREDRTVPVDAAFILARALRHAELHVFPHCGHWAQWEKADAFNHLVLGFLERPE